MDFEYSAKTKELQKKLLAFMDEHIYPNEPKSCRQSSFTTWPRMSASAPTNGRLIRRLWSG